MDLINPLDEKPRRRIEFIAKISADSWRDLEHELHHLSTEIARRGSLSASSVSGGYSTGHIVVTSEDDTITHDRWAAEINTYLEELKARETAACPT